MGRVVHFEIPADDPDRALKFYNEVFGWQHQTWNEGTEPYHLLSTGPEDEPGIHGGLMRRQNPDHPLSVTVDVDDLDAAIERVTAAGGQLAMPKMAVPGVGWLAYFLDPEHNCLGMMQRDPGAK